MDRFAKIAAAIAGGDVDALLITGESNRFYAAGFPASDGVAVVTGEKSYFFTDSRYIEAAQMAISGAEVAVVVSGTQGYIDRINEVVAAHGVKRLGFEEDVMSYGTYLAFSRGVKAELVPAQKVLSDLRRIKEPGELEIMRKAQVIAEKAFSDLVPMISTEMTEKELAAELLYRMQKFGADDKSFDTIAVSAEKSSMPHGVPGDVKIKKGFLTIDFGVKYRGYCSDTTRTLCIGQPSPEMKKVYDTVLRAQIAAEEAARAGISGKALDGVARDVIAAAGYGECFTHSLSHGVGIDIHESPSASLRSVDVIPAGAVISNEPGIYLPGKFGVRIEDVLIIKEGGCENITHLPKELVVL